MNIHELLNPSDQSELAVVDTVDRMKRKLKDAMISSPKCEGSEDDHEYYALFDSTAVHDDGELFWLRSFLKTRSYVAIGLESIYGNRTLVMPHDSRHAIVTDIPLVEIKSEGFRVDKRADLNELHRFDPVIDLLVGVIKGETSGKGFVEGEWIEA